MGQEDIVKILKKNKGWMDSQEILKKYGNIKRGSIVRALNSMFKYGEVLRRRKKDKGYWTYEWRLK